MIPDVQPPPGWADTQFNALYYLPPPYVATPATPPAPLPTFDERVDELPSPSTGIYPPVGPSSAGIPAAAKGGTFTYEVWVAFPMVNWATLQALYIQYVAAFVGQGIGWSSVASAPAAVATATSMLEWYAAASLVHADFVAHVFTDGVRAWGELPVRVFVTYTAD